MVKLKLITNVGVVNVEYEIMPNRYLRIKSERALSEEELQAVYRNARKTDEIQRTERDLMEEYDSLSDEEKLRRLKELRDLKGY